MADKLLLMCNCEKTVRLDGVALGTVLGRAEVPVHTQLCGSENGILEAALKAGKPLCVGCTQQAPQFAELASGQSAPPPRFFNLRETAGWAKTADAPTAKIAALVAAATVDVRPAPTMTITSDGQCLVYGTGQEALDAALLLNRHLSVTLVLKDGAGIILPRVLDIPIFSGRLRTITGSLGAFDVVVDGYAAMLPSSRGAPTFAPPRDGARSKCSVVVDLSGGAPLFSRHHGRDGYFRADPGDPAAVLRAVFDASDYVGTFEKTIYAEVQRDVCAHARSQKTGCAKCIDNCPAGAVASDGDAVAIDTGICGGCGNCAAHCPTGAISYLFPHRQDFIARIQTLASAYIAAGGDDAVLLLHDGKHGAALINAMARFGRGLPSNVIPLEMHAVTGVGHDALCAAFAAGFRNVVLLADPANVVELSAFEEERKLTDSILSGCGFGTGRVSVLLENDPDIVEANLWELRPAQEIARSAFRPVGSKRAVARLAIAALAETAENTPEIIAVPDTAPYGTLEVNGEACTLCLACVSACPAGALRDNPEKPQLRFIEHACVQCGLCAQTCPENAVALKPRLNLLPSAMQPATLNEEEPFPCIRCGKPFASRSAVERIAERLSGVHRMYQSPERIAILKMCETCRLEALSEQSDDPFAIAQRPRVRTTKDYFAARDQGVPVEDSPATDE